MSKGQVQSSVRYREGLEGPISSDCSKPSCFSATDLEALGTCHDVSHEPNDTTMGIPNQRQTPFSPTNISLCG